MHILDKSINDYGEREFSDFLKGNFVKCTRSWKKYQHYYLILNRQNAKRHKPPYIGFDKSYSTTPNTNTKAEMTCFVRVV